MKFSNVCIILLALTFVGCQKSSELAIQDLNFGNKRVGLKQDIPKLFRGESALINFKVVGAEANSSGMCTVSVRLNFDRGFFAPDYYEVDEYHDEIYDRTHLDEAIMDQLFTIERQTYRKNSEITALSVGNLQFTVPLYSGGDRGFEIEVTDHESGQVLTQRVNFEVEIWDVDYQAESQLWACANHLRVINEAVDTVIKERGTFPSSMDQLAPYLDRTLHCPAVDADTYHLVVTPKHIEVRCQGDNHRFARGTVDHPKIINYLVSYR